MHLLTPLADPGSSDPLAVGLHRTGADPEDVTDMSEEAEKARQALQESMDLREQGHADD